MSQHIHIQNFTIIQHLDLEWQQGLTALTGETGAGKSIIIDALDLALGGRGDSALIRHGSDRCDISVTFDLSTLLDAAQWLADHEFEQENQLILRRTLSRDGRSRAYIQGQPVTLQQLKDLGAYLVNIHGQHEHQSLMKRESQRELLDNYGQYGNLVKQMTEYYTLWKNSQDKLDKLRAQDHTARAELLRYQIQELDLLALKEGEIPELEQEHKQLAHASQLVTDGHAALEILSQSTPFQQVRQLLTQLQHIDPRTNPIMELFNTTSIHLQETMTELQRYLDQLEINPDQLILVEQRLEAVHDLARKHHVLPENLLSLHQDLSQELKQLENSEEDLAALEKTATEALSHYHKTASLLSVQRQKTAEILSAAITQSMQTLGMPGGCFTVQITPLLQPSVSGMEKIEFQVSANPGQPVQPLTKVASGGELSRISLAIQVMTAQRNTTPTLIFDEVDVGIGGGTAEIVGHLLRQLGEKTQVLCVTHLAQVASKAHHHFQVQKHTENNHTHTQIQVLNLDEKIQEIARMLGGLKITEQTLAHAEEMLNSQIPPA